MRGSLYQTPIFFLNFESVIKLIAKGNCSRMSNVCINVCCGNVNFLYGNFVEYIDYDKRDTIQKWTPFHKFSNLSEQLEFRIIFDSPCIGALRYDIGAIEDIAVQGFIKKTFRK